MTRTILRGGTVLTMGRSNYEAADVLIDGDTIAEIGPGLRARDAEVVDAAGTIVMPGFVDAHRHTWESLFRNLGDGGGARDHGRHYTPDDVYASTLVGLLGAVSAGITSVVDWCEVANSPAHLEASRQAHADTGVRSVLVHGAAPWAAGPWQEGLRRAAAAGATALLTPAAGPADPRRDDPAATAESWAAARELGLRIHAHAAVAAGEEGVLSAMAERGQLGPDTTLVHCTRATEQDLDAVASSGAAVALAPSLEMASGLGAPPIQELIDRNIRPGLGVDTEQVSPGDLFAQMRAVISIQHATRFDLKLAGKAGLPRLLTTRDVIRYATVDGAHAAGLDAVTGALEPGKQADIIVLRADRPNIFPINDPIGAVVWGMDTSNVDWVFVAGRALVRGGDLEFDIPRARTLAMEAQRRVLAAAGTLAGTATGAGE